MPCLQELLPAAILLIPSAAEVRPLSRRCKPLLHERRRGRPSNLPHSTFRRQPSVFWGSDQPLVEHRLGHLAEAGDIRAIHVVHEPLLLAVVDALAVDGGHDLGEALFHLLARP